MKKPLKNKQSVQVNDDSHKSKQSATVTGDENIVIQLNDSENATVEVNKIDEEKLAEKLYQKLEEKNQNKYEENLQSKEEEIKKLKTIIKNLQKDETDDYKQKALKALEETNTEKAMTLMELSANCKTEKGKDFLKKAAEDWIDIGNLSYYTDSKKPLEAYTKATELDPLNKDAWNKLGLILQRLGKLDEAENAYTQVMNLSGSDKEFWAIASGNLGIIYQTRGSFDKAEEYYLKAMGLYNDLGCKGGMAKQYCNLGTLYESRGDLDKAEEQYLKAIKNEKILGREEGMASDYGNLGNIYETRGDFDKAEGYYLKSLEIDAKFGKKEGLANQYSNLSKIYQRRGDTAKAEALCFKALKINEALGRKEGMASDYCNLGVLYAIRGGLDKSCAFWQKGLELYSEIGAKDMVDNVSGWIDQYCSKIDDAAS